MTDKLFRIYNRGMQRLSNVLFSSVLSTPPIPVSAGAPVVIYTVLDRRACRAYLFAIKSLLRFCPTVDVVVQSDGSLTPTQIAELKAHIPGCTVYGRDEMDDIMRQVVPAETLAAFPERMVPGPATLPMFFVKVKLLNTLCRFPGRHVVLIDSDILCLKRPEFVIDWITRRPHHNFYGGGGMVLAERFRRVGFPFSKVDVGNFNSGLIGVYNDFSFSEVEAIVRRIRAVDEGLFQSWEIEQALWAVLYDSRDGAVNIDTHGSLYVGSGWQTYRQLLDAAVFVHFVGAIRFKNFRYVRLARDIARELRAAPGASVGARASIEPHV